MEQIQVIIGKRAQKTLEGKVITSSKKFIDLEEMDTGFCCLLKISHLGINTLINTSNLTKHVILTVDDGGKVISRLICKSSSESGVYILSIQEKNLLFLSQDIMAEEWRSISNVRLN